MRYGPLPLDQAEGKILGHNIADGAGRRILRKGRALDAAGIAALRAAGHRSVYVAELEPEDIGEDAAAREIAAAVAGPGVQLGFASGGRVNLVAQAIGVARIDAARVHGINAIEGITLATIMPHTAVTPKQIVATIKVIPFAVPRIAVEAAVRVARSVEAQTVGVDALPPRRAALILSGMPGARERVTGDFVPAIRERLEALGSTLDWVDYVQLEAEDHERELATMLVRRIDQGAGAIVLAGETAIMDRADIAPRAIARAGGEVTCFGAPVDPGNLLLVAYRGDVPILGAPGCARSRKVNVVDWVLPRLLAGDRLTRADITALGVGGLLDEIAERPAPRGARRD